MNESKHFAKLWSINFKILTLESCKFLVVIYTSVDNDESHFTYLWLSDLVDESQKLFAIIIFKLCISSVARNAVEAPETTFFKTPS